MDEIEVTIKDSTVNPLVLAKWVHSVSGCLLRDSLKIARNLLSGETWKHRGYISLQENPFCNVKLIETERDKIFREEREIQRTYYELLRKGAEGDVNAALEYCKFEFAGKISHGAYA